MTNSPRPKKKQRAKKPRSAMVAFKRYKALLEATDKPRSGATGSRLLAVQRECVALRKRASDAEREREERLDLDVAKRTVMLTAEVAAYRETIRIYGDHVHDCTRRPCSCGFAKAWANAKLPS